MPGTSMSRLNRAHARRIATTKQTQGDGDPLPGLDEMEGVPANSRRDFGAVADRRQRIMELLGLE